MAAHLRHVVLHRGPLVRIGACYCGSPKCGAGHAEASEGYDIVFIRRGVFARRYLGASHIADANSVVFFSKGIEYTVAHPCDGGDVCTIFSVPDSVLREAVASDIPRIADGEMLLPLSHLPASPRAFMHAQVLASSLRRDACDPLAAEELSMQILSEVIGDMRERLGGAPGARRTSTQAAHRDLAERAKSVVARDHASRLTLDEVASASYSSPYHLARVFRTQTGMTLSEYRQHLRVRLAMDRLLDGERDLSTLAIDLGFFDHSHFSNAFRQVFGITPRDVRGLPLSQSNPPLN